MCALTQSHHTHILLVPNECSSRFGRCYSGLSKQNVIIVCRHRYFVVVVFFFLFHLEFECCKQNMKDNSVAAEVTSNFSSSV